MIIQKPPSLPMGPKALMAIASQAREAKQTGDKTKGQQIIDEKIYPYGRPVSPSAFLPKAFSIAGVFFSDETISKEYEKYKAFLMIPYEKGIVFTINKGFKRMDIFIENESIQNVLMLDLLNKEIPKTFSQKCQALLSHTDCAVIACYQQDNKQQYIFFVCQNVSFNELYNYYRLNVSKLKIETDFHALALNDLANIQPNKDAASRPYAQDDTRLHIPKLTQTANGQSPNKAYGANTLDALDDAGIKNRDMINENTQNSLVSPVDKDTAITIFHHYVADKSSVQQANNLDSCIWRFAKDVSNANTCPAYQIFHLGMDNNHQTNFIFLLLPDPKKVSSVLVAKCSNGDYLYANMTYNQAMLFSSKL